MQAQASDLQQQAGQRARDQRGQRRTAEENGNRLAALGAGQPAGEVINHPRKKPGLGHTEQEAQDIKVGFVLDKGHQRGRDAPGEHDAGQPDARADFLQQHIGRHFKECIANKKQPGAKAIGRRANPQIMLHVRAHKADIDPVDVVNDKHDDEERQDMALHFMDRARQDGVVGGRSRHVFDSIHRAKPH